MVILDAFAAHVYDYDGTDWALQTKFSTGFPFSAFIDLDFAGDTVVVGSAHVRAAHAFKLGARAGTSYCTPAVPNSTGSPARMLVGSTTVAADDDLGLRAVALPTDQIGYFLMGQGQNTITPPGSDGPLCILGNGLVRLLPPVLNSGYGGELSHDRGTTGLPAVGAIVAGETWNFQGWFRDVNQTSNLTDAVSVTFN